MAQPKEYRVVQERNLMVPMRDGVLLATDVLRPDGPGPFPVLVTRGPYGKDGYLNNPDHSVWRLQTRRCTILQRIRPTSCCP